MTYRTASIKLKRVKDEELNEYLWIIFRNGITEPLLVLPQFEMDQIAKFVTAYGPDSCQRCGATLTDADREAGACTQCGELIR
jgi:hypothetical protein